MLALLLALPILSLLASAAPLPHSARLGARTLRHLQERSPKKNAAAKHGADVTSSGPNFVYYADRWEDDGVPPASSDIAGWNVFALGFWLSTGAADMALGWADLTADQRSSVKADYASAGIKLIVTAFGSTESPATAGEDPTTLANSLVSFVQANSLDGVDVDFEDFDAMNAGTAVDWLVTFTKAVRSGLGDDAWLSHAPVAPWFTDSTTAYPSGDYLQVDQQVGSMIDAYNIQFYNQGTDAYTDCAGLITTSPIASFPNTALLEIMKNVDGSKLLIGKPGNTGDATNGYMDFGTLATCVATAQAAGWNGGLMVWEFPDAPADFVSSVWGSGSTGGSGGGSSTSSVSSSSSSSSSSSVSPSSTSTPVTTSAPVTSTSVTPSSSSSSAAPTITGTGGTTCATAPAWDAATAYTQGSSVTYSGSLYTAASWSYNESPTGASQAWTLVKAC